MQLETPQSCQQNRAVTDKCGHSTLFNCSQNISHLCFHQPTGSK